MRFEGKNKLLKSYISRCFKNVPLTAAIHHQQWMCYKLAARPGQTTSNYLYPGDKIVSGLYNVHVMYFLCIVSEWVVLNAELLIKHSIVEV